MRRAGAVVRPAEAGVRPTEAGVRPVEVGVRPAEVAGGKGRRVRAESHLSSAANEQEMREW